jgi:hypothetical protein
VCITQGRERSPDECPPLKATGIAANGVAQWTLSISGIQAGATASVPLLVDYGVAAGTGTRFDVSLLTVSAAAAATPAPSPSPSAPPSASPTPFPTPLGTVATFTVTTRITSLSTDQSAFAYITVTNTSGADITRIRITAWTPARVYLNGPPEVPLPPCATPSPGSASRGPTGGSPDPARVSPSADGAAPSADATSPPSARISCWAVAATVAADPVTASAPLAPGDSTTYALGVRTDKRITPGDDKLVFEVSASGAAGASSQVIAQDLSLAIQGESEIVAALSVPFILFVPGFIAVIVFGKLANKLLKWTGSTSVTEATTWAAAVPVSLGLAALYPAITDFGPIKRAVNGPLMIIGPHDLYDIGAVWLIGIVLAALLVLLIRAARDAYHLLRPRVDEWWQRRYIAEAGDQPITALEKLAKTNPSMMRPVATSGGRLGFVAGQKPASSDATVRVIPKIQLTATFPTDDEARRRLRDVKAELVAEGHPGRLASLLRTADITAAWLPGLTRVPADVPTPVTIEGEGLIAQLRTNSPERGR